MMDAPQQGKRYDEYEPWKYACISVDDAYLEGVAERLTSIDFYWHTLSVKGKGLAYCGVKHLFHLVRQRHLLMSLQIILNYPN